MCHSLQPKRLCLLEHLLEHARREAKLTAIQAHARDVTQEGLCLRSINTLGSTLCAPWVGNT